VVQGATTHVNFFEQITLSDAVWPRLVVASVLGGVVGLEREWRHKDSGLRTNMLICMGAALFTVMSEVLAGSATPNKGQVAANIVQGVGFLGAGLILHTKSRVLGLTSAATVFVVAAIGMTCGAGMYMGAVLATVLLLIALWAVGFMEGRLGWKRFSMIYEVRAQVGTTRDKDVVGAERADARADAIEAARLRMLSAILRVTDAAGQPLHLLERGNIAGLERVCFSLIATQPMHQSVLEQLRASDATDQVVSFQDMGAE